VFLRPFGESETALPARADFLIIGHRGDPWNAPENTIAAFDLALKNGANALEIDLCLSKDGEVVVWHDWDPNAAVAQFRASGQEQSQGFRPFYPENEFLRPVPELSLAELQTHYGFAKNRWTPFPSQKLKASIPSFDEFLEWASRQKCLKAVFLDIKVPEESPEYMAKLIPKMVESLCARSLGFDPVFMTPFESLFAEMKQHAGGYDCCLDREVVAAVFSGSEQEALEFGTVQHALRLGNRFASIGRPTFLSLAPWEIYCNILRRDIQLRNDRDKQMKIIAWTVDDTREMRELVKMGLDGILTNRPGRLARKVLRRKTMEVLGQMPTQ
jgi:glycerophosphoryl diester phosphodiesterase